MSHCIVWVLRDCLFFGSNKKGIYLQPLAVLPDHIVAQGNHPAETQNKCEGGDDQHSALADRTLQRRTAQDPYKINSANEAAYQPTQMGGDFDKFALVETLRTNTSVTKTTSKPPAQSGWDSIP